MYAKTLLELILGWGQLFISPQEGFALCELVWSSFEVRWLSKTEILDPQTIKAAWNAVTYPVTPISFLMLTIG